MNRLNKIILILSGCFVTIILLMLLTTLPVPPKGKQLEMEAGYDKPEGYSAFYQQITTPIGQKKNGYEPGYRLVEYNKAKRNKQKSAQFAPADYEWVHRGPGNVGGRTREVIIDPDDTSNQTWFAAAASGGVWKTSDGGNTWRNLTDNILNLATNTMAMAPSNHNVIYIGTGEGYGGFGMVSGNGIYRSNNRGESWIPMASTQQQEAFKWINKIVVGADDENTLLVATNSGIFKTRDGGNSWDSVYYTGYAVQDFEVNPLNPNVIYAAVNSLGIIKSYDEGNSWENAYSGIGTGYRFSLTMSPVDTSYIFTCVEARNQETEIYISRDGAQSWNKLRDSDFTFVHFLGEQGWFNNVIKAHPFDRNKVYIGGVNLGSIEFSTGISTSESQVLRADTLGTGSFLRFVNFGGELFRGGLATGLAEKAEVKAEDYVSVEIRFGPGLEQKAHRFSVPEGEGAGVPPSAYYYEDYVNVPFEAWDTDNNRQLMISFRDQDNDGSFNLIEREWDDDVRGREYIFVHAADYDDQFPLEDIAQTGGYNYKMLYFLWPTLPEDKNWEPDNLPVSSIRITYGQFQLQNATTFVLADENKNKNLHVDHHDIEIAITDAENEQFIMVEANDGGLGLSYDQGKSWEQINQGYLTTQFYGVAKKPGAHEYIGGMQDNGTWQSPWGENAEAGSAYSDRIKGDGFEVLWHPRYPQRIIGSSYYNLIQVTTDGGETWNSANEGILGTGPFITRLSNSPDNPDLVFAVGSRGVYRHKNFGIGRYPWQYVQIDTGWSVTNQVSSSHNVEVSLANPKIVWAGAGLFEDPDLFIFRSADYGETFEKVSLFPQREMGYITGIATHPANDKKAFLLFSMDHKPKILKTEDAGQSWEDISGFGADSSSANGFPDVAVYSLLVFPQDTNVIWAGTEIGIFESTDNGGNWHQADNGFPAVSVWQMFIQDNTLVVGTHGRGIWTCVNYPLSIKPVPEPEVEINLYPNPTQGIVNIKSSARLSGRLKIAVYNLAGVEQFSLFENQTAGIFEAQIDLSGLPAGMYLVSIHQDNRIITRRIQKQ